MSGTQRTFRLNHANIVPVYAVGCERGVHYFPMQYIEEHTLADVIRQLRQPSGLDGAVAPGASRVVPSQASRAAASPAATADRADSRSAAFELASELVSGRFPPAKRGGGTARGALLPLSHPPGEAQVDFGEATVKLVGQETKVALFVTTLPYSGAIFVQAFPRECTETFLEGHQRAFEFFGGVPTRISYDNTSIVVTKVLQGRDRKLTKEFLRLQSSRRW